MGARRGGLRGDHSVQPLTDPDLSGAWNGQGPALPPAPAPHTSRLGGLRRKGQSTDPRLQVQGPTSEAQHRLGQRGRRAEGPASPGPVLGQDWAFSSLLYPIAWQVLSHPRPVDEENAGQRGKVTCPKSHSLEGPAWPRLGAPSPPAPTPDQLLMCCSRGSSLGMRSQRRGETRLLGGRCRCGQRPLSHTRLHTRCLDTAHISWSTAPAILRVPA